MANGDVTVATSGKMVESNDRCAKCDSAMLYIVRDEVPEYRFCQHPHCELWLVPVYEPAAQESEG